MITNAEANYIQSERCSHVTSGVTRIIYCVEEEEEEEEYFYLTPYRHYTNTGYHGNQ